MWSVRHVKHHPHSNIHMIPDPTCQRVNPPPTDGISVDSLHDPPSPLVLRCLVKWIPLRVLECGRGGLVEGSERGEEAAPGWQAWHREAACCCETLHLK